jgi:hypothetical protein
MVLLRARSTSQGVDAVVELAGRSEADAEVATKTTAASSIKMRTIYIILPP